MNLPTAPQFIHQGYLQKRMLFGWRRHYCILRGRQLELYRISAKDKPHENPSRVFIVEKFHAELSASDQFEVSVSRGSKKTFKLEPEQMKRGERAQWIHALQTALLCDNALEKYGEDITKQLIKQASESGKLRQDDSIWKTLRKRSIHGDLWSRFQELIAKGIEVLEVVELPAKGLPYILRIDDPPRDILFHPVDNTYELRRIELKYVLSATDCLSCDATQRLTRFDLTYIVDEKAVTETFQTHTIDMRSRLVFGLSHILKNFQLSPKQQVLRRLTVSPPPMLRERTSDASSRSISSSVEGSLLDSVIRSFNVNPSKGVTHGIDQGVIDEHNPESVAEFLRHTRGLDKDKIGEYLGGDGELRLGVLSKFASSFEFAEKPFEVCLREFLSKFRLPGEGQKIDRIMEAFAKAFVAMNPRIFRHHDAAHILAFSTIMLNTDLHNPSMKSRARMSKPEFVRNNRGIDKDKTDVPLSILESIFDSIKKQALVTVRERDDNGNLFANPDMSGWLRYYRGSGIKSKRHWFMLCSHCLYFFDNETDIDPLGFYSLENVKVLTVPNRPTCFELRASNSTVKSALYPKRAKNRGYLSHRSHVRVVFVADKMEDASMWCQLLEKNVLTNEHAAQLMKKGPVVTLREESKRGSISASYEDIDESSDEEGTNTP